MNCDRVVVEMDEHVRMMIEFMQRSIPAEKLIGVADHLPDISRLLWDKFPQEPVIPIIMREKPPIATESDLGRVDADGDSVVEGCVPAQ